MTDQELVELFWQRREEALTGLQDKYGGWCRSIAGRILGEERDVEECLGDCWLQLWNAIPPARPQHFRGYLGAVVRNRALLLRREGPRTAFLRRYWYADTVEETAGHLGWSLSRTKSVLFRTRKKLKAYLEQEGML